MTLSKHLHFYSWLKMLPLIDLKTLDTFGNCQRPVFSLGVSQHMHKITNLWKFELNWSSELRNNNGTKNTLVTRSCVLSDAWFRDLTREVRDLTREVEVSRSIQILYWEITSFSKTTLLQREPFLTMFYTINSSSLLVTNKVFMLTIILSNYQ